MMCYSDRNETFDAIIIEQLWYQCFYSLVKHYNYPILIGFLSVGNLPYAMDSVGKYSNLDLSSLNLFSKLKKRKKENGIYLHVFLSRNVK